MKPLFPGIRREKSSKYTTSKRSKERFCPNNSGIVTIIVLSDK